MLEELLHTKAKTDYLNNQAKKLTINRTGKEAYSFFSTFVDCEANDTLIISTTNDFNILNHVTEYHSIINLSRVNDIRYINKFFESVNSVLENDDFFICCLETFTARRERKPIGRIPIIGSIYFFLEFIFMRVFPKTWGLKKIYFLFTRGRNRLLSKAEGLGRLVSCGFEIIEYKSFNGLLYVVSKKVKKPEFNMNASYGPVYKMPRMGKNGRMIGVYKFRTMHPYAEYLQDYVLKVNGYADSGKPADDFRLTPWGKFLRRYWLDETPQMLNVLKGELKLVGVRPVSLRYFNDIPRDLQKLRLKQRPGCIPPYVALNRKGNVDSVLQSEKEYLKEKLRYPYTTDTKYFFKAVYNIVFKSKRSA